MFSSLVECYFDEHSLVQQQIESFNEFIRSTLFDIVEVNKSLSVTATTPQGHIQKHIVTFGQTYLGSPTIVNADGSSSPILPQEARLRNLTYASSLFVDIDIKSYISTTTHPVATLNNAIEPDVCRHDSTLYLHH